MQLDYIINNRISERDFEQVVYRWLSEGDYTPDDIIENIITQNNIGLMPLYYYKNDYQGSCSASLGYPREEYYYEWDNVNKKQVRRSRWVTDWHPHSQAIHGTVITVVYAGSLIPEQIAIFIENMGWKGNDLHAVSENDAHYNDMINLFQISKSDSWSNRGIKKAYNTAQKNTVSELPSTLVQNLSLNISFTETHFFSLLAPYWLFKYEYQEKQYYVIADGNDPARIDGIKPEDKKRKNHVIKLRWYGWAVGIIATIMTLYIFSPDTFGDLNPNGQDTIIVISGLILTGILVEYEVGKIKKKSIRARKEILNRKLKQLNN